MTLLRTRALLAGSLALLTAVSFTGCGKSQDAADKATTANSPAAGPCQGQSNDKAPTPTKVVLALVPSSNSNQLVDNAKPLADYLTKKLDVPVEAKVTPDYQAAVEALGAGQAQIGLLPSLQLSQACEKYGAKPALQSIRTDKQGKDRNTYAGMFTTNNPDKYCTNKAVKGPNGHMYCNGTETTTGPAGLDSLAKIKGSKVAMQPTSSAAGYIFPAASLKEKGIDPAKDIQVITTKGHDNGINAVYKGDAEVATTFWDARDTLVKQYPDVGSKLVAFALTDEIPNDGVAFSGKLPSGFQKRIGDAMKEFGKTPEGKKTLQSIYQLDGFVDADVPALQKTSDLAKRAGLG